MLDKMNCIRRLEYQDRKKFAQYSVALEGLGLESEGERNARLSTKAVFGTSNTRNTLAKSRAQARDATQTDDRRRFLRALQDAKLASDRNKATATAGWGVNDTSAA